MHVHIIGICGTFMTGIALLARRLGYEVTGSDQNVYPPMSDVLSDAGIAASTGYSAAAFERVPDVVIIGNALSRGNPEVEACLDRGLAYTSGPEWLAREVLQDRWVIAVAGTHGKTTTSAMITWILRECGMSPGHLIGGLAPGIGVPASLGEAPFFVVEADEYDTAFFDKRSKFVHYHPRTVVLNNLEFDHADIFPDLNAIQTQFHHLVRTVPSSGLLIRPVPDRALDDMLARGCWSEVLPIGLEVGALQARLLTADGSAFSVTASDGATHWVEWTLLGTHNVLNGTAALAAARHAGVPLHEGVQALGTFTGVKRRLERIGSPGGVTVYDDFAHHPTAVAATLSALRGANPAARLLAVLELRSNTMRAGVHHESLASALADANTVFALAPPDSAGALAEALAPLGDRAHVAGDTETIVRRVADIARAGDHVVIMSNGDFNGIHNRLLKRLGDKAQGTLEEVQRR